SAARGPLSIPWSRPPPEKICPAAPRCRGNIATADIVEAIVFPIKRKNIDPTRGSCVRSDLRQAPQHRPATQHRPHAQGKGLTSSVPPAAPWPPAHPPYQ